MCVICGLTNVAYLRSDGVFVVLLTALKKGEKAGKGPKGRLLRRFLELCSVAGKSHHSHMGKCRYKDKQSAESCQLFIVFPLFTMNEKAGGTFVSHNR